VTKTFTAALLARQLEEGTLHLADPIDRHFPADYRLGLSEKQITVLDLATHHAGLQRDPDHFPQASGAAFAPFDRCLLHQPGDRTCMNRDTHRTGAYAYSNFGIQILGYAVMPTCRVGSSC
jgi:D-alanyl-D-alanine-carboxypeptidase/D-alanyl-D-alanine-endopeptidase